MEKNLRSVIWLAILMGFTSTFYLISLPLHLPVIATALVIAVWGYFSYRWLKSIVPASNTDMLQKADKTRAYIFLLAGVIAIIFRSHNLAMQYGHWDSWWLWDHHAQYLQDPVHWKQLFTLNDDFHPDYPLLLSSIVAFVWRLIGSNTIVVSYAIGFIFALIIPVTIFLSLYTRNLAVAAFAFIILIFNDAYITFASAQYADQPLGFFFLCTIICQQYVSGNKWMPAVIGMLLGCCIWTKNEGMLLALVFMLFHYKPLLANGNYKRLLVGISLPLFCYVFLKINAPANDLVRGQNMTTIHNLFNLSRYQLIIHFFYIRFIGYATAISIAAVAYGAYCFAARRSPGRNILMLLTCAAGYGMVYVLTPHDLEWHLSFSFDRVLFQLIPAIVYVMANNFAKLNVSVSEQFQ
jgi:hypothetical protein